MTSADIEIELRRLHRQNRALQLWCALLTTCLAVACLTASSSPQDGTVRARRFELVDEDGKLWGQMEVKDGEAGLALFDSGPDSARVVALGTGAAGAFTFESDDGVRHTWGAQEGPLHASLSVGGSSGGRFQFTSLVASPNRTGTIATDSLVEADTFLGVGRSDEEGVGAWLRMVGDSGEGGTGAFIVQASASAGVEMEASYEGEVVRKATLNARADDLQLDLRGNASKNAGIHLDLGDAAPAIIVKDEDGRERFRAP